MANKKQILLDVPCEVVAWLGKRADESLRSVRAEATWLLIEAFKANGGTVGAAEIVPDEVATAAMR